MQTNKILSNITLELQERSIQLHTHYKSGKLNFSSCFHTMEQHMDTILEDMMELIDRSHLLHKNYNDQDFIKLINDIGCEMKLIELELESC